MECALIWPVKNLYSGEVVCVDTVKPSLEGWKSEPYWPDMASFDEIVLDYTAAYYEYTCDTEDNSWHWGYLFHIYNIPVTFRLRGEYYKDARKHLSVFECIELLHKFASVAEVISKL